jgi:small subunit ribosomal protein S14
MSKKCLVERDRKRRQMYNGRKDKRAELKSIIHDKNRTVEERFEASMKLAEMPRNSSKTRIDNRCAMTGRSKGYLRRFNLSRNAMRNLALKGELPGVTKSSW